MEETASLDFTVEIIHRMKDEPGFHVLPRRCVVERTFAWMTRWQRLVHDFETLIDVFEPWPMSRPVARS